MSEGAGSDRKFVFEVVVTAVLDVSAVDGRAAREAVAGMFDGVSARLLSGSGAGSELRDVHVLPSGVTLRTLDGADPTVAVRAALDAFGGGRGRRNTPG